MTNKKKTTDELLQELIDLVAPISNIARNEIGKINRSMAAEQALAEKINEQSKTEQDEKN